MERRIMLVGRMGNGKSATGNSLIGQSVFRCGNSLNSVTLNYNICRILSRHQVLMLIDTPGFFSTDATFKERSLEIQRYVVEHSLMPHAILLTFSLARATDLQDRDTLKMLSILFGEPVFRHCIVVFTHANAKGTDGEFGRYWQTDGVLREIVEKCNGRVVRVENRNLDEQNDDQINDHNDLGPLLDLIEQVSQGGNSGYSYPKIILHRQFLETLPAANGQDISKAFEDLENFLRKRQRSKVAKYALVCLGIGAIAVGVKLTLHFSNKGVEFVNKKLNEAAQRYIEDNIPKAIPKAIEQPVPNDQALSVITAANAGITGSLLATGLVTGNPVILGIGLGWGAVSAVGEWLSS